MFLTKENCDIIVKDAFKEKEIPEWTVEDINRVLDICTDRTKYLLKLRFIDCKQPNEINRMLGHKNDAYFEKDYKKFLNKVVYSYTINWMRDTPVKFTGDTEIEYLKLSVHTYTQLHRKGIKTISDLCNHTCKELIKSRYISSISLREIEESLNQIGFKLKDDELVDYNYAIKELDVNIDIGFNIHVCGDMIPVVYSTCYNRHKNRNKPNICKGCPYKGDKLECMFTIKPIYWV